MPGSVYVILHVCLIGGIFFLGLGGYAPQSPPFGWGPTFTVLERTKPKAWEKEDGAVLLDFEVRRFDVEGDQPSVLLPRSKPLRPDVGLVLLLNGVVAGPQIEGGLLVWVWGLRPQRVLFFGYTQKMGGDDVAYGLCSERFGRGECPRVVYFERIPKPWARYGSSA